MKNKRIIEASRLPIEEKVYLRKDNYGWRVVNPIKKEDGTYNYFNLIFGGKRNLRTLIIIMVLFAMLLTSVWYLLKDCDDMAKNPCKYTNLDCSAYNGGFPIINNWKSPNLSEVNFNGKIKS